jgi:hypothetical protein
MKARRLYVSWLVSEHWRISEIMYLREEAQGPATVIDIRPVLRLKNRIFIKGGAFLDLSERMRKQKYELAVRKSWRNLSSVNFGYWKTAGTLFPRRGTDLTTVFYLGKKGKVGFSPNLQLYWRHDPDSDAFRFYRTDASAEMILRLFPRAEITGGYSYSRFIDLAPFTDRGVISIGLKKW